MHSCEVFIENVAYVVRKQESTKEPLHSLLVVV